MGTKKIEIYHKPNWHPSQSATMGDIRGQYGYVTEAGTIHLLGPDSRADADISKYETETELKGPLASITAKPGLLS